MAKDLRKLLRNHFHHDSFRPGQEQVINTLLDGRSALAIFPTGGGKSLCYQLPALIFDGLTLVISPLIALMKDQVEALTALGIAAARLDSTLELSEVREIYEKMSRGTVKLVYIAPERLGNDGFLRQLRQCQIAMLTVDEAHCISEWGHNFRPDYLKLADLARDLGISRVLALTATATPEVAADIRERFAIARADHIQTPFYRKNLTFQVTPCPSERKKDLLVERIKSRPPGPTVVYVTLQRTAEEVAGHLSRAGLRARAYHAGMRDEHRADLQDDFMIDKVSIIVATIAFGMGIDKANVRQVYHFNLPKSLENYVQESGRAGRDGGPAICEILASRSDLTVLENFVYGDTPSPTAIKSLVEHLVYQGDHFSISKYDLSFSKDIRPLVIATAITYLEIEGVIIPRGPFYAGYRYLFLQPEKRILAGHPPAKRALLEKIFKASQKARIWHTVDVAEMSVAISESESDIRAALNDLSALGEIKAQPTGLRHAYQLSPGGERSVSVLTKRLMNCFATREQSEINRLHLVIDHCEAADCLAGRILRYFGDDYLACGQCSACTGENPGKKLGSRPTPGITPEQVEVIQALNAKNHRALKQPRQLARFLCGLSSPATTRAKLQQNDHFGMLEEIPFMDVLAHTESLI